MDKTVEICEMALIINREIGFNLEISAAIAEALYDEGYHKSTHPKVGMWDSLGDLFYKCTSCGCFSNDTPTYCPHCGSMNCCTYTSKGDSHGRKQN